MLVLHGLAAGPNNLVHALRQEPLVLVRVTTAAVAFQQRVQDIRRPVELSHATIGVDDLRPKRRVERDRCCGRRRRLVFSITPITKTILLQLLLLLFLQLLHKGFQLVHFVALAPKAQPNAVQGHVGRHSLAWVIVVVVVVVQALHEGVHAVGRLRQTAVGPGLEQERVGGGVGLDHALVVLRCSSSMLVVVVPFPNNHCSAWSRVATERGSGASRTSTKMCTVSKSYRNCDCCCSARSRSQSSGADMSFVLSSYWHLSPGPRASTNARRDCNCAVPPVSGTLAPYGCYSQVMFPAPTAPTGPRPSEWSWRPTGCC